MQKKVGAFLKKGAFHPGIDYNYARGEVNISIGKFDVSGLGLPLRKQPQLEKQPTAPLMYLESSLVQTHKLALVEPFLLKDLRSAQVVSLTSPSGPCQLDPTCEGLPSLCLGGMGCIRPAERAWGRAPAPVRPLGCTQSPPNSPLDGNSTSQIEGKNSIKQNRRGKK